MWPCETRAAKSAMTGEMPSLFCSTRATASVDGVTSCRWRQRERIVGSTSCRVGAHKSQTVRLPGSSIAFSNAFAADSVKRSASSMTTTRQPPIEGAQETRVRSSLTSSILMERPSVRMISTSGCAPFAADLHSLQVPHPLLVQTSA